MVSKSGVKGKIKLNSKKLSKYKSKLILLQHLNKRSCALFPFLSDESLHTLGEFVFNIILQRVDLNTKQEKKIKKILNKDKDFMSN